VGRVSVAVVLEVRVVAMADRHVAAPGPVAVFVGVVGHVGVGPALVPVVVVAVVGVPVVEVVGVVAVVDGDMAAPGPVHVVVMPVRLALSGDIIPGVVLGMHGSKSTPVPG
jgi:hypothetical protein